MQSSEYQMHKWKNLLTRALRNDGKHNETTIPNDYSGHYKNTKLSLSFTN
jgi:hypothetical protein